MDYISSILNKLLDRVDKRKIKNGSSLKRAVSLYTDKEKIFEKYWAEDSYNYRPNIHDAVDSLVQKGFIIAEYDRDTELLKKVTLNNNNITEAYAFLNRIPKQIIIDEDIKRAKALLTLIEESTVSYRYLSKMISLLESGDAHLAYFKSLEELAISTSIVKEIENNENEILLRNFSKKKFKDSKLVEKNDGKLVRIFNEFDERQYSDFSELCSTHYIFKDKGYAYVKHGFCFKINNQIIDLDALNVDFAFSDEAIDKMDSLSFFDDSDDWYNLEEYKTTFRVLDSVLQDIDNCEAIFAVDADEEDEDYDYYAHDVVVLIKNVNAKYFIKVYTDCIYPDDNVLFSKVSLTELENQATQLQKQGYRELQYCAWEDKD